MLYIPRRRTIAKPRLDEIQRFGISGRLRSVLIDHETGKVTRTLNRNIITEAGLAAFPPSWFGAPSAYVTKVGCGSGITTPLATDVALTTQVGSLKAITEPLDNSNLTGSTPYSSITVQFTPSEVVGNLAEAGLFTSTDVLRNHALFGRDTPTDATTDEPVVIESEDHGLVNENEPRVRFDGILGMTQLNFTTNGNTYYYVSVLDADHFALYEDAALNTPLDGNAFGTFSGAGTWTIVVDKTAARTFYVTFEIQAQNGA